MKTSMIQVNEYFKCHLQGRMWQSLSVDEQTAAVNMAETDISLAVGCAEPDIGDLLIFCAICEQAIYLAMNRNETVSQRGELKSETIEGVGKREYFEPSTGQNSRRVVQLAPRCELFLSRVPSYSTIRFGRG